METSSDNRFAQFTADNHSAPIWIASILSLLFAICILAVRLGFVKWNAHGLDDVVLTLAHIVGLGMWGSLFSSLDNGLGRSLKLLTTVDIAQMQKSFYASRILLWIALAISKCSALIFIQSIFNYTIRVNLIANITTGVVVIWGLVCSIAVSINCPPDHIIPSVGSGHCVNQTPWITVAVIGDVITEMVIILLPIVGLYNLQMPTKPRLLVILAFSFRIPNIITSVMHFISYTDYIKHDRQAIDIAPAVVWQNALLSYNLMSATIPALKGFVKEFTTGGVGYSKDMSMSGGNASSNSYELRSLSKSRTKVRLVPQDYAESEVQVTSVQRTPPGASSRLDKTSREKLRSDKDETDSITSFGSHRIMIKRAWEVSRG